MFSLFDLILIAAMGWSSATGEPDLTLITSGAFQNPCVRSSCSMSCTFQLSFQQLGPASVQWGVPLSGADQQSTAFILGATQLLPPLGQEFIVGRIFLGNGVTRLGTELTSIEVLFVAFVNELVPPLVLGFYREPLCIITTPNSTGDPVRDGDVYILPEALGGGIGVQVPEHGSGVLRVLGVRFVPTLASATEPRQPPALAPGRGDQPDWTIRVTGVDAEGDAQLVSVRDVKVDMRPGQCPNDLNLSHRCRRNGQQRFDVALVGSADVDLNAIDRETVQMVFGNGRRVRPIGFQMRDESSAANSADPCVCEERAPDNLQDLVLQFDGSAVAGAAFALGEPSGASVLVAIQGRFNDGGYFQASDCVHLIDGGGCQEGARGSQTPVTPSPG